MPGFDSARVKRSGRHFTPRALAVFLAEQAAAHLPRGRALRVIDPACGDGELLLAAHSVLTAAGRRVAELVGCELDPGTAALAQARMDGVAGRRVHVGDFLELAGDAGARGLFDLVITNPPYVRTQVLGAELSGALAARFGLEGRVDLTHPFVALSSRLLHPAGVLALLCSNRFLSTKAGGNVRRVLDRDFAVRAIYDLGDTKLFRAAVLPAVVIAARNAADGPVPDVEAAADGSTGAAGAARFARAYETPAPGAGQAAGSGPGGPGERAGRAPDRAPSVLEALTGGTSRVVSVARKAYAIEVGTLVRGASDGPWVLRTRESDRWLRGIEQGTWRTFGQVARTRVGIKTTADAVFIRDDWGSLDPRTRPEDDLLLPLVTHENVRPWRVSDTPRTRVLYPYDLGKDRREVLAMDRFPRSMAYLTAHEERLRGRRYVVDGGRQWFEIWVPQRPALWKQPKIVFPDISAEARFALDTSGSVVNGDCYWISFRDLPGEDIGFLMLAVANSELGLRFYDTVCGNRLYSGRRRWITQYVDRLPLPDPAHPAAVRAVALARNLPRTPPGGAAEREVRSRIEAAVREAFAAGAGG